MIAAKAIQIAAGSARTIGFRWSQVGGDPVDLSDYTMSAKLSNDQVLVATVTDAADGRFKVKIEEEHTQGLAAGKSTSLVVSYTDTAGDKDALAIVPLEVIVP